MEKLDLKQVIIDQKGELKNLIKREKIIEREFLDIYKKYVRSDIIKVITGIRRCGKSIFSQQLLSEQNFAYINFDDERLVALETKDLNNILEIFYEVYGEFKFVLLDEVQNIYGWELFVNRLKRQGFNIIVTGSNAKLLSKELATHLTGRHVALELFPFSFREFLNYHGISIKSLLTTRDIGLIKRKLNEYIKTGGFPETLKRSIIPKTYLQALYSTIISKDIVLRHRIKFIRTLKDIASYLITNHSSLMSFNKIKNIFNLKSIHTALNYVSFLEESYLFFFLKRLSFKQKESLVANRKVYCLDTGLINALSFKSSRDLGKLYENIVATELLRKKAWQNNIDIYYWQDIYKYEVDFVIKQGLKIKQLIQVYYSIEDYETKKREIKALLRAGHELKCKNFLVITEDKEDEETIENNKIRFMPLWKWLLEK